MSDLIKADAMKRTIPLDMYLHDSTYSLQVFETLYDYKRLEENAKSLVSKGCDETQARIISARQEVAYAWRTLKQIATPLNAIEVREGSKGKFFEYLKDYYVRDLITKLFPNWWQEDMQTTYVPNVATYETTGSLLFTYNDPLGNPIIKKVYASAGFTLKASSEDATKPVNVDDGSKASVTEWWKMVAKRIPVGEDVFSGKVTPTMEKILQEILICMHPEMQERYSKFASRITVGKTYREFIMQLPKPYHFQQLDSILEQYNIKSEKVIADMELRLSKTNCVSENEKERPEYFLEKLEEKLTHKQQEGASNE